MTLAVFASSTFVAATPLPAAAAAECSIPSLWVVDDIVTYNITLKGGLNTSFGTPNGARSSIAVDPADRSLWGVNEGSRRNPPGKLVNYSRTGVVIQEIDATEFGAFSGEGMAVAVESGNNSLWVVDDPDPSMPTRVPTVYHVARDGSLISSFPTSLFSAAARSPQAIAYDRYTSSLWITDNSADTVYNVSTAGDLLGSFPTDAGPFVTAANPAGVTNPQGITVESAKDLWITDRTTAALYRVRKNGKKVKRSFPASVFDPSSSNPTGVAFDTATPNPMADTLDEIVGKLQALIDPDPGSDLADKLDDVASKLETATEELCKEPADNQAAAGAIEGAVGDLEAAIDDSLFADPVDGIAIAKRILEVAGQLATDALADAQGGDADKLAEAEAYVGEGDGLRAEGKYKDAAAAYKSAVAAAEGA